MSDGITTRTVEVICANIRTMKMILKGRPHKVSFQQAACSFIGFGSSSGSLHRVSFSLAHSRLYITH